MNRFISIATVAFLAASFAAGIATATDTQAVLFGADMLLPSDWVHNLLHDPGTVRAFEWPRIPSLFPDMLGVLLLSLVVPAWRVALLCYAVAQFTALVLIGGTVTARLAGRPFAPAALTFGALAAVVLLADMQFDAGLSAFYLILYPVIHSGSVLCTFGALLLVRRWLATPTRGMAAGLVALVAVATLSDRLFIATFVVPALAGAFAWLRPGLRRPWVRWRPWLVLLGLVAAGCIAGTLLDRAIFHTVLVRQPDVGIKLSSILSRLPGLLHDPYVYIEVTCAVCAALVPSLWAGRSPEGRFWWAAAGVGSVALLGALPIVYIDWTSYRYMQPIWWWALIAVAALVARVRPAMPWQGPVAALAGGGLALSAAMSIRDDLFDVRALATWRHPAEVCLSDLRRSGAIHAGLAGYWLTRPIVASSDWTLPVVQVGENGKPFLWGNNRRAYGAGRDGALPPFDFVLLSMLDPAAIRARFGAPDRELDCAGLPVWTYADPARINARLTGTDRRLGLAEGPLRFTPTDLYGVGGALPADGSVPPGRDPASWGPFAAIAPGAWRMVLRYRFTGTPEPTGWEVRASPRTPPLAAGAFEPGTDRVLVAPFTMPAGREMELYTHVKAADRLAITGLGLCPAAMADTECVRATAP